MFENAFVFKNALTTTPLEWTITQSELYWIAFQNTTSRHLEITMNKLTSICNVELAKYAYKICRAETLLYTFRVDTKSVLHYIFFGLRTSRFVRPNKPQRISVHLPWTTWNSPYNDSFFRNFITNLSQDTIHSPLLHGNPLLANMIIDLLMRNARRLAEQSWNLGSTPSPMCICGTSEQNNYHFLCCPNYCNFRTFHLLSFDLFIPDDCAIISNFISCTSIH